MFPNWDSSVSNDPAQYAAWADEAQDNASYHSPATSPKSSSSSYDSCSEEFGALSLGESSGTGVFSGLSKMGSGMLRGSGSRSSSEVDLQQLTKHVKKAYKDLRYYHGTNATSSHSIRSHGMRVRLKRGGLVEIGLAESPNQPPEAIQRARRYNYLATICSAAKSYAILASVTSTLTREPKPGEDGVPRLVRIFKTADFPLLEKDSDFPLAFASFLNPLYRTAADIPAHAVRQFGRGSARYSRQIVSALRDQMQSKYKFSASVEQVRQCLSDVESDSDDDFPKRSRR